MECINLRSVLLNPGKRENYTALRRVARRSMDAFIGIYCDNDIDWMCHPEEAHIFYMIAISVAGRGALELPVAQRLARFKERRLYGTMLAPVSDTGYGFNLDDEPWSPLYVGLIIPKRLDHDVPDLP